MGCPCATEFFFFFLILLGIRNPGEGGSEILVRADPGEGGSGTEYFLLLAISFFGLEFEDSVNG